LWIVCLLHRKLKQQCSLDSAKTAKQQMQLYKAQIVHSMNEEYKEMMRQALDEVSALNFLFTFVWEYSLWFYLYHCGILEYWSLRVGIERTLVLPRSSVMNPAHWFSLVEVSALMRLVGWQEGHSVKTTYLPEQGTGYLRFTLKMVI